jgi:nucleoside-diphosphate-sugar epimerase
MKILVTGANGFIGKHVVRELQKTPHTIIATSVEPDVSVLTGVVPERIVYLPCNLNDARENYFDYFQRPDLLIHLAWEGLPKYQELFHFERNLLSNYIFLKNMVTHGVTDCTVIGTCLEYGLHNGCLSEEIETAPVTAYGLAKDTLRKFLIELQKQQDFTLKWVRLFYLYGEGQSQHALLEQVKRAITSHAESFKMSGGEQLRDYLPVETVAEYLVAIALQHRVTGSINCCSGQPISVRKLVENYLAEHQATLRLNLGHYPYPDYEPMAFWGNVEKLQKIVSDP